jgi:hypothetical protein
VTYWQAITDYLVLRMVVIYTRDVGAWAHNICVSCNVFYQMNTRSISVQEMTMGATAKHAAGHTSVASLTQKSLTSRAILQFIRPNSLVLAMRCMDGSGGKSG